MFWRFIMKKFFKVLIIITFIVALFTACGVADSSNKNKLQNDIFIKQGDQDEQGKKEDNVEQLPRKDNETALNAQYIRTEYFYDTENPFPTGITVVSSTNEMEQYYEKHMRRTWDGYGNIIPDYNFLSVIERYSDDFFANNFLVIVSLTEGSGSIRHEVERIDDNGDIVINRLLPEVGTDDIASWSIIIELNNNLKIEQFQTILVDIKRDIYR